LVVNSRGCDHHETLFAVAGNDHFSIFAALEDSFPAIETEAGFRPVLPVAAHAGVFQQRLNIFFERHALLV
jgi:hypothetical protein